MWISEFYIYAFKFKTSVLCWGLLEDFNSFSFIGFSGLMPRDKPKGQTLREVKRMSEQRKERDKVRRDGDDSLDGQGER